MTDLDLVERFLETFYLGEEMENDKKILIKEKFKDMGVKCQDHFEFIEEADMTGILTVIQLRQFKKSKDRRGQIQIPTISTPTNKGVPDYESIASSSYSSSDSFASTTCTSDWAETVDLDLSKLPGPVIRNLEKGVPNSEQRRLLVRTVIDVLREKTTRLTCAQLRTISKRLIQKYEVLKDTINGNVVGCGYSSLFNQLVARNDNQNRGKSPFRKKSKTDNIEDNVKITSTKDAYGCVNFQPCIDNLEGQECLKSELVDHSKEVVVNWETVSLKLKETYPLQRLNINKGMPIKDLLDNWSLLFKLEGIFLHFQLLTGKDIMKVYNNQQWERLNSFYREECEGKDGQGSEDFSDMVIKTVKYFNEDLDWLLLHVDDTLTASEIEIKNDKETPRIAVLGSSPKVARQFMILVDGVVVTTCEKFHFAFLAYFCLFYILNICYPTRLSATLEFVQRCIVGINPANGTKGAKRRRYEVNAKVLKLISEVSKFEWTGVYDP